MIIIVFKWSYLITYNDDTLISISNISGHKCYFYSFIRTKMCCFIWPYLYIISHITSNVHLVKN